MQHLAIIPDGNRRWAKKNKLRSFFGHKKGMDTFKVASEFCLKNSIRYLSIYTFSLENFNRSDDEKKYLFELLINQAKNELQDFVKNGIRVRFIGNKKYFPEHVLKAVEVLESKTKHLDKLNLNLLFCYGSKNEITHAVKELAKRVKAGVLAVEEINEESISNYLWTAGMPNPDLIIRTSGICRLSNFLLYQAAYSEFMFLDCHWPEITSAHLQKCYDNFKNIKRNFGE
ncbi:polyprenyl diphosphate synthase [Candidatus Dependentiae bacterium]